MGARSQQALAKDKQIAALEAQVAALSERAAAAEAQRDEARQLVMTVYLLESERARESDIERHSARAPRVSARASWARTLHPQP